MTVHPYDISITRWELKETPARRGFDRSRNEERVDSDQISAGEEADCCLIAAPDVLVLFPAGRAADPPTSSCSSSSSFVNGATSKNLPAVQTVGPMPEDTMENMRTPTGPPQDHHRAVISQACVGCSRALPPEGVGAQPRRFAALPGSVLCLQLR
ncbi:hypothetical protein NFI96_004873 [Prochilodus magdalenae]|nr:hypothetical protein NFI96_004873 [Prochilodus magdalenae]